MPLQWALISFMWAHTYIYAHIRYNTIQTHAWIFTQLESLVKFILSFWLFPFLHLPVTFLIPTAYMDNLVYIPQQVYLFSYNSFAWAYAYMHTHTQRHASICIINDNMFHIEIWKGDFLNLFPGLLFLFFPQVKILFSLFERQKNRELPSTDACGPGSTGS